MPHPRKEEIIPVNTVCLWQRDKSKPPIKVTIKKHVDLHGSFLHYEIQRSDRPESDRYSAYHSDLSPIKEVN